MEEKDLIKKLEEISLPAIELPTHKARLKSVLIERYFQEKRRGEFFGFFRKLLPVGMVAIILIILISTNLIFPKYSLAKAKEIALQDPQIKEWVEKGAVIKDVEIIQNRAYVLIQPPEKTREVPIEGKTAIGVPSVSNVEKEEFKGALAEVNMREKKITKIEKITPPIITLTETEKEKVREIAEKDLKVSGIIPKEAEIQEISSLPPQLELIKKGNSVQIMPEPKTENRASIIYQSGEKRWEGKIDLSKERVEEVKFLGEIEE